MNSFKISIQNLKAKPLYTILSISVLSLSIALLIGTQQIKHAFKHQIKNNVGEIDLVVGAKGSPLQLVLASVLHIDNPTGNISYTEALKLKNNRLIERAVPISYGDNYKGYKIIGTENSFYSFYNATILQGRYARKPHEAVVGYEVAKNQNLTLGDTFFSSHGLVENTIEKHHNPSKIVGILRPSKKIIDHLIITPLETIWETHNHIENEEIHTHSDNKKHTSQHTKAYLKDKEITSLLITFKSPLGFLTLPRTINKNTNMQAAIPKYELDRFYSFSGIGLTTVTYIAYFILIIAALTMFISIYRMVKDRAFDFALLRTYGANNIQLIQIILYESLSIVITAFVFGYLLIQVLFYTQLQFTNSVTYQYLTQQLPWLQIFLIFTLAVITAITSVTLAIIPLFTKSISYILSNEK